jgi:hypothetical protein
MVGVVCSWCFPQWKNKEGSRYTRKAAETQATKHGSRLCVSDTSVLVSLFLARPKPVAMLCRPFLQCQHCKYHSAHHDWSSCFWQCAVTVVLYCWHFIPTMHQQLWCSAKNNAVIVGERSGEVSVVEQTICHCSYQELALQLNYALSLL